MKAIHWILLISVLANFVCLYLLMSHPAPSYDKKVDSLMWVVSIQQKQISIDSMKTARLQMLLPSLDSAIIKKEKDFSNLAQKYEKERLHILVADPYGQLELLSKNIGKRR